VGVHDPPLCFYGGTALGGVAPPPLVGSPLL